LLQGKRIIVEGGDQTRDPCYVTDTLDAWVRAIEAPKEKVVGEIFQVSTSKEYKVREIAEICTKIAPGKIIYKDYRPGEKGQRECFEISKARRILGYNPKIDLEEGLIKKTKEWIEKVLKNEI
jgi:nucleoside-diphosphate-sugar epimerase